MDDVRDSLDRSDDLFHRAAGVGDKPRASQSPQQLEADCQDCKRWATTQPSAQADASVFQRAVTACIDGRGYTVR